MKLAPEVLQKTILAMFATRNLHHGDMVWLSRFEEFWSQTQLRRADLLDGLADLCSRGWIVLEEHDERTSLALSPKGDYLARRLVAEGLTSVERYVREQVLATLRFREEHPNQRGVGRRWHEGSQGPYAS